jgi:hypothetical protein
MSDIYYDHEMPAPNEWTNPLLHEFCDEDIPKSAIEECIYRLDEQWFETDIPRIGAHAPTQSLAEEFIYLADLWRNETENVSSMTRVISHSAYQRIIELGKRDRPAVIGLILSDLSKRRGYWAVALQAISGENPVRSNHIGNPAKVREDWLQWGKRNGFVG